MFAFLLTCTCCQIPWNCSESPSSSTLYPHASRMLKGTEETSRSDATNPERDAALHFHNSSSQTEKHKHKRRARHSAVGRPVRVRWVPRSTQKNVRTSSAGTRDVSDAGATYPGCNTFLHTSLMSPELPFPAASSWSNWLACSRQPSSWSG